MRRYWHASRRPTSVLEGQASNANGARERLADPVRIGKRVRSPARSYSQPSPSADSAAAFACSALHAAYCSAVSIVTKPFMR